jgi:putative copper export protein
MNNFAQWLAQTQVSIAIQSHLWIIPAVQSVHIVAIGIVMGSVFMIDLRIWGFTGRDRTLQQTVRRFTPWLWGALIVLLATGVVMITGEPVRELMSFSFWLKMFQLAVGITLAVAFRVPAT